VHVRGAQVEVVMRMGVMIVMMAVDMIVIMVMP
jgi:hypothetical protein